jgi:polyphosphate kinase
MGKLYNSKYYHRDLSWLRFNHRVLQEAADKRNPLYERIKFLAIFSSNLDEFFKVRVSDIRQIKNIEKPLRKKLITKPNKALREIKKQVELQQEEFGAIFNAHIVPELKKHQIHLINFKDFSTNQKEIAKTYFQEVLKDKIKINKYSTSEKNQVFVENEALYLTAQLNDNEFAVINIPEEEPRFFTFPKHSGKHYITFIDDILKYNLRLNPKMEQDITFYSIKKSRDAELYIENELSGNLAEKIKNSLSKRDTGQATRLLIDKRMPAPFQETLKKALDVYNADIVNGGTYHNFKDFFEFPNPTETNLSNEKLPPLPLPVLGDCDSILAEVEKKDQLLHYPYQSFEPLIRLLEEAAEDPQVTTIKMTIYRAAEKSRLNDAIVAAAKKGKKVVVFIEVKARFDEQNNLKWGQIFEENGASVIYSFPDIKIHSKILYIEKKTEDGTQRYGYIATGNFNENTAKLYTDFGLMTADKKITKDLNKVFLVLQQKVLVPKTKRLLVSPYTTRSGFTELVQTEMQFARAGQPANITLKMNSLEDKAMIKLLYRANNAGVKIRLLVRGICSLIPGVKGQSENIQVTSIIDRFLEHGRVYIFGNNGDPKIFIGSADWMKRNLSHRIEVVTPIFDEDHKKTIQDLIELQLKDNVKARIIDGKQENNFVKSNQNSIQSQLETYNYFKKRN